MKLPLDWQLTTVGEIAEVRGGKRLPKGRDLVDFDTGFPYIRVTDMHEGGVKIDQIKYVPKDIAASISRYRIFYDDLFITVAGTLGIVGEIPKELNGANLTENADKLTNIQINKSYLCAYLQSPFIKKLIDAEQTQNAQPKLAIERIKKFPIVIPPKAEQIAIADLFYEWDSAIEKTERLIAAKERRFSVVRERFLQKTQQTKRVKLQAVTRESAARNGASLGRDSIMAVTKKVGMRPMKEETIASGIERYKVVRPRGFAYNPMRLNIGSIAMSPFDADVLVSPDYVVFECDESRLLSGYLNHLRFSRHWTNYFESAGNGSVRVRIYYDDLSAFTLDLPPVDVQKRIVDFLDAVGLEIDLLKKQAEAYRRQKRGLMQKLLTGAWRVKVDTDQCGLTPTNTD